MGATTTRFASKTKFNYYDMHRFYVMASQFKMKEITIASTFGTNIVLDDNCDEDNNRSNRLHIPDTKY